MKKLLYLNKKFSNFHAKLLFQEYFFRKKRVSQADLVIRIWIEYFKKKRKIYPNHIILYLILMIRTNENGQDTLNF